MPKFSTSLPLVGSLEHAVQGGGGVAEGGKHLGYLLVAQCPEASLGLLCQQVQLVGELLEPTPSGRIQHHQLGQTVVRL